MQRCQGFWKMRHEVVGRSTLAVGATEGGTGPMVIRLEAADTLIKQLA